MRAFSGIDVVYELTFYLLIYLVTYHCRYICCQHICIVLTVHSVSRHEYVVVQVVPW